MLSAISAQHEIINSLESLKSKGIHTDSVQCFSSVVHQDSIDNPVHSNETSKTESNIFKQMKYERNRLYSFQDKWPLPDITPESLARAGLFYLQHEDKVQCPFCQIKLCNWTHGDNPLREHMRARPRCPFLIGCDVGNVPMHQEDLKLSTNITKRNCSSYSNFVYKPKHPKMSDAKRRLLTYSGWPVNWLTPQQLSECGLYYSGVADVVTCFFCGGSLGNWEPNDDPWNEHRKFFPNCPFLSATQNMGQHSKASATCEEKTQESLHMLKSDSGSELSFDITSDFIHEAQEIFPKEVVLESVRRKGGNVLSLEELCDDILEVKQDHKENTSLLGLDNTEPKDNTSSSTSQALLCVICMDKGRGIVYQPCGHFVSCPSCSTKINNCPVCRKAITHKIRTYI